MIVLGATKPQGLVPDETPLAPPAPEATLPEVIGAAFAQENAVVAGIDLLTRPTYRTDPNFDILNWMGDRSDVLLNHRDRFVGLSSADEAEAVLGRIEREKKQRELLDSSGLPGVLAGVAAGAMDPTVLVPGIAYAKGARLANTARLAGGTAAITGGATAAQEVALQASQELRTRQDAMINVLAATMVGGVLGGAAGYLTKAEIDDLAAKVVDDMGGTPGVQASLNPVGAAAVATAGSGAKPAFGAERVTRGIGPVSRQISNPDFASARKIMPKLADAGLTLADNAAGVPTGVSREGGGGTIENRAKFWYAGEAQAIPEVDRFYADYWFDGNAPSKMAALRAKAGSEIARYSGSLDGRLTAKEFREQITIAHRNGDEHPIPQVAAAAKLVREKVYKPIFEEAKKVGMPGFKDDAVVGDATYAPRVYLQDKIAARPDGFIDALRTHFSTILRSEWQDDVAKYADAGDAAKMKLFEKWRERGVDFDFADGRFAPESYADEISKEVTADILGSNPMRLAEPDIITGPRGPEKARTLSIASSAIEEYLENDAERLMRIYTRSMASDLELQREFGSLTLEKEFKELLEELETLREGKPEKEATRLNNAYEASKRDLTAVLQRLRHQYALPDNPNGIGHRLANTIVSLNYLRLMGGVTLSSVPDLARPIMRYGLTSAFADGFVPFIRQLPQYKLGARETKLAGTALDLVLDTRTQALADLQEGWMRGTKFERGLEWTTNKFGMVNLMSYWNTALKQIAGTITVANLTRAAKRMSEGANDPKTVEAMAANGIDRTMAARIWRQIGEVEGGGQRIDGEWWPNTANWSDDGARRAFSAAIVREVDNAIVTPGVEKPLWTNRLLGSPELGRILGQFRGFGMASTSKMLVAGLQQRDAAFLSGLLLSVGLGGLSVWAKANIAGGKAQAEMEKGGPAWWATNGVDASGILAVIGDVNRIMERTPVGGLSNITGETIQKTQAGDVFSAGIGPTADLAIRAVRGTFGQFTRDDSGGIDYSPTQTNIHDLRMLAPGQNIPYGIRQMFDAVESGFNDTFGIPKRRPQ